MRVLLDTNAVLWWFSDDPVLPQSMEELIDDPANAVLVCAASAWEICTKVRIGKLPSGRALCEDFAGYLARYHFDPLPDLYRACAPRRPNGWNPQRPIRSDAGGTGLDRGGAACDQ